MIKTITIIGLIFLIGAYLDYRGYKKLKNKNQKYVIKNTTKRYLSNVSHHQKRISTEYDLPIPSFLKEDWRRPKKGNLKRKVNGFYINRLNGFLIFRIK